MGQGISFDLGVAGEVNQQWTVSLGLKNIISNIDWNNGAQQRYYSFSMDSVNLFKIIEEDSVVDSEEFEEDLSSINSTLPQLLHLGCAYKHHKLTLAMELIQGFRERPGSSSIPKLALGIEYKVLPWFPIRSGFSVGGDDRFSSAIGLGFKMGPLAFDFGMSNKGGFILQNQKGALMALSLGLWF